MSNLFNHLLVNGVTVEVTDPKYPKSTHPTSFVGKVSYCDQFQVLVKDAEDHSYNVFLDEIMCLLSHEGRNTYYCLRSGDQGYDVLCILPTGFIETLATDLDHTTADLVIDLLSKPAQMQKVAA
ncbi:MAG: hypothetical protein R3E57_07095 [Porticoccaceae bacterium]|jgi:hypothetical protein